MTEPLLDVVVHDYGLRRPACATLLRAWTNDVYALATPDGRFILKVYRAGWRSVSEVTWEVELQDHLARQGAGVAAVIPRRDGNLVGAIHAPEGERAVALFGAAEGAKPVPPFSLELYAHVGRAAARLHQAANTFVPSTTRPEVDLAALIDQPLRVIRPWLADRPDDLALVERTAAGTRERLSALIARELDWGICHGDLTLDNVHVAPDDRIMFYDFDSAAYGWRAWEVCGVRAYKLEAWDAYLGGYTDVRPFSANDRAAVYDFAGANALWMMDAELRRWTQWFGTERVAAWVDGTLDWLRQWEAGI